MRCRTASARIATREAFRPSPQPHAPAVQNAPAHGSSPTKLVSRAPRAVQSKNPWAAAYPESLLSGRRDIVAQAREETFPDARISGWRDRASFAASLPFIPIWGTLFKKRVHTLFSLIAGKAA